MAPDPVAAPAAPAPPPPPPPAGPPAGGGGQAPAGPGSEAGGGQGGAAPQAGQANQGDQAQDAPESAPPETAGTDAAATAAATSRPGQGTQRGAAMKHADRFVVEGDYVGQKNIYLLGGLGTGRLRLVSPPLVESSRMTFVDPAGWADVRAAAEKLSTVILRGLTGHGKMAAAIRLLLPLEGPLYLLDDAVDLARLAESLDNADEAAGGDGPDAPGSGFILSQPAGLLRLRAVDLQRIEEVLLRTRSKLIITVAKDGPTVPPDLVSYLVDLPGPPGSREVITAHLRWRLESETVVGRLLSEDGEVHGIITEQVQLGLSCERAAWLAGAIAEEHLSGEQFDAERIARNVSRRGAREFDVWFTGLRDSETRAFAIALAVLNGLEHERIGRAAKRLHDRLGKPPDLLLAAGPEPPEGVGPFRRTRSQLLQRLRARVETAQITGPSGLGSDAQTLVYQDSQYAKQVIEHMWTDYQIHDILLTWLGELAEDPSDDVRVAAGSALGLLAVLSFDFVSRNALHPWSASDHTGRRDAVAYATRVMAADPALVGHVRALTSGWYVDRASPLKQATAARVHGVGLGPLDPEAAVGALERLFAVSDIQVAVSVGDSLADLLEAHGDRIVLRVLSGLGDAVDESDRATAARLGFLILADGLLSREQDPGEREPVSWPTLLRAAKADRRVAEKLAGLWDHVLNGSMFHTESQAVLGSWAGRAEADEEMRDVLLRLLRGVGRLNSRSLDILERCAHTWDARDNLAPLPVIAETLRVVIAMERKGMS